MPTNVTAEYAAAELEYFKAKTIDQKLKALKKMLSKVPKHKGTEKLQKEIKEKIRKLKYKKEKEIKQKKSSFSLSIKKEGAAQIVLVGPPNTGKSSLLNKLTQANSPVGDYPFTTKLPEIGILNYQGVPLQIVDLPSIIENGSLKQAELFAIIRNADLVIIVTDPFSQIDYLFKEFEKSNLKLNKPQPAIKIQKQLSGGIEIIGQKLIKAPLEKVKAIVRTKFHNALIKVFAPAALTDFTEAINEGLAYLPALIVLNKDDLLDSPERLKELKNKYPHFTIIPLSTLKNKNLKLLKQKLWQKLGLIKVYTKEPRKKTKKEEPLALKKDSTIKDMASQIHKDFIKKFRYAKIWGHSAKFDSQIVGLNHQLKDGDIVEVHLK